MRTSLVIRIAPVAAVLAVAVPAAAHAQNAAVVSNPATLELGADAGAQFGLGANSYTYVYIPGQRLRVGFFLPGASRVEIEPAAGLTYTKTGGSPGRSIYNVELGALYHFTAPARVNATVGATTVAYVRPFIAVDGNSGAGTNENTFTFGGGLGIKVPFRPNISLRGEANLGYNTTNKAARIGVLAGLSFFTFR